MSAFLPEARKRPFRPHRLGAAGQVTFRDSPHIITIYDVSSASGKTGQLVNGNTPDQAIRQFLMHANGELWWDDDGTGGNAAVLICTLTGLSSSCWPTSR